MKHDTCILGISAYYHDSAACLLRNGEIIAAAQEERFTRKKGDNSFPAQAVEFCLHKGKIQTVDLKYVGFYDKPLLKFERILETFLGVVPRGFRSFLMAGPLWIQEKHYNSLLRELAQSEGIALIDLEKDFQHKSDKTKYFFDDHYHPSRTGAEYIANIISEQMVQIMRK